VVFRTQFAPERLRAMAVAAEESGVDELWLWEDCFGESGTSTAAAVLAWTQRLRVGIGLLPVPLRNVATTAMEAATLARMFPGRIDVGLGHGVQDWMGQVGARVASPMTLLRENVVAVKALLRGETVTTDGRYVKLDRVKLDWPPDVVPPILVGATKEKTMDLAAEIADGTILTAGVTASAARAAVERVKGRAPHGHQVVMYLAAAFGPDADERITADFAAWDQETPAELLVSGDPARVATLARPWFEAGVDRVILQPNADEPDLAAYARWSAEVAATPEWSGSRATR
jgi:alkanesulfonate monooxygenase SsuD/methylene tetrahydromethanopterin reductase-like flavin-dependent oxidoreductase (luciferase family)